ncbi:hypothetical protein L195_g001851 [Trifolium pratense]|uniref:Uncharacterized protein n=1 Tax=Trifolium pratense TaxID=57577 RepID=A0A2K3NQT2_TRIPR|nr:hypothetical protein L195_g001851 [Trifolium pratense]
MAAESNSGFHYGDMNSSLNWHAISFQSGAVSSLPEMVPMGNYFGLNNDTSGNASGCSLLVDSVPGLKHDAGLAAEWSVDEQYKLEEGLLNFFRILYPCVTQHPLYGRYSGCYGCYIKLPRACPVAATGRSAIVFHCITLVFFLFFSSFMARYADEPSIMRYVKIAASLRDKTVRDVALRCRWMTRKRRKSEDHMLKKANNRKDKPVESSPKQYLQPVVTTYSCIPHHMDRSQRIVYDDGVCGPMKRLLEQNAQAFSQINSNLSTFKGLFSGLNHLNMADYPQLKYMISNQFLATPMPTILLLEVIGCTHSLMESVGVSITKKVTQFQRSNFELRPSLIPYFQSIEISCDHKDAVLEVLSEDYDSFITMDMAGLIVSLSVSAT